MKQKSVFLAFLMMVCCTMASYAQVTATGVVVDATTGEPVIGASVLERGTNNGTITDIDGNFTLEVADGAVLEISYVGFRSQILPASAAMRVVMITTPLAAREP